MGTTVQDMQVGCLWQGDFLLSVSLSGYINYLDPNNPSKPMRIIKGKVIGHSTHHLLVSNILYIEIGIWVRFGGRGVHQVACD